MRVRHVLVTQHKAQNYHIPSRLPVFKNTLMQVLYQKHSYKMEVVSREDRRWKACPSKAMGMGDELE